MPLLRIRLSFSHTSVEPKNCWFLVDTSVCRVVADLEYLIRERFDLRKVKRGGAIDLFLDEYLLPSQESIQVIRDNDVIRVQESMLHTENKIPPEKQRATKRKGNGQEHSPKRQHLQVSADEDKEENDTTQAKQSKTSLEKNKERKKQKSQNLPLKNGSASERTGERDEKQKYTRQRHSTKHLNEQRTNSIAVATKSDTISTRVSKDRLGSQHSSNHRSASLSSSTLSAATAELVISQSDEASAKNGYPSVPQVVDRHTDNEGSVVSAVGSTRLGSDAEMHHFPRKQMEQRQPRLPVRKPNTPSIQSGASVNSSTHVRFDFDDDDPEASEDKGQEATVSTPVMTCPRGTESTASHNATPTIPLGAQLQRHRNDVEQNTEQQSSVIDRTVSTSLTPGQQQQAECSNSQTLGKVPKDYSQFVALHGPPRAGDRIAYKILELSASYTPEISDYKEGTVLGYDSKSDTVHLQLTIESLNKPLGDGNVSKKFELVYEEEGEEEDEEKVETPVSEEDRKVTVLWSSMRDPILLSAGTANQMLLYS